MRSEAGGIGKDHAAIFGQPFRLQGPDIMPRDFRKRQASHQGVFQQVRTALRKVVGDIHHLPDPVPVFQELLEPVQQQPHRSWQGIRPYPGDFGNQLFGANARKGMESSSFRLLRVSLPALVEPGDIAVQPDQRPNLVRPFRHRVTELGNGDHRSPARAFSIRRRQPA